VLHVLWKREEIKFICFEVSQVVASRNSGKSRLKARHECRAWKSLDGVGDCLNIQHSRKLNCIYTVVKY
jgi:hypothetical protein